MLNRDGERIQHQVPGYSARLTDSELASYNAAFATIERGYKQIEDVIKQLERLAKVNWELEPDPKPFGVVTTPDSKKWDAYGILLALPRSEVLLCRQREGSEWAVVQRFKTNGLYTQAHGDAAVLLTGGDSARRLVDEYVGQAEHTLRFMARNLVAQAQQVVWEKYADHNPSQVVRAISQRCALAVDNPQALKQEQTIERGMKQSRGMSI